jgi:hypothetical protein
MLFKYCCKNKLPIKLTLGLIQSIFTALQIHVKRQDLMTNKILSNLLYLSEKFPGK